ncbi:hypothetical protein FOZ62_027034 [Perkinsus olseni]|uniref:WAP domain-containing protein n=1 Tax=Perkinsus olseni TaxID=32597 RepID=A0A7J6SX11_PEROL|nr:hypothetical protein FOZ62_027034 [Perkinsus olseni]
MPCPFAYLPACAAGIFGGAGVLAAVDHRYWTYSATMSVVGSVPLLVLGIRDLANDKLPFTHRSMAYLAAGSISLVMGVYLLVRKPWLRTAKNLQDDTWILVANRSMRIALLLPLILKTITAADDAGSEPLVCPPVLSGTAGICVEMCSAEQLCGGEEMCCPNGCGHLCMAGVTEEEAEQIRQAQDNPSGATRAVSLLVGVSVIGLLFHEEAFVWRLARKGSHVVVRVGDWVDEGKRRRCVNGRRNEDGIIGLLAQPGELCCSNGCGKVCKVGVTQAEYDKLADFNKRSITGFSLMIDFNDNADLDEIAANLKSEKLGKIFPASTESPNVSILHALKMAIVKVKTSEREDADALEDFVKGIPAVSAATKSMEIEWNYAKDSAVVGRGPAEVEEM